MNDLAGMLEIFRLIVISGILAGVVYTDLSSGKIPNKLTLGALAGGLLLAIVTGGCSSMDKGAGFAAGAIRGLTRSVLGVFAGGGPFLAVWLGGLAFNRPWIGGGDVKLMGAIGCFLGPWGGLMTLYYGLWIGVIVALAVNGVSLLARRGFQRTIPLGACLAAGAMFVLYGLAGEIGR